MSKRYILFVEDDEIIKFWDKKNSQMYYFSTAGFVRAPGNFQMHAKFHPYSEFSETDERPAERWSNMMTPEFSRKMAKAHSAPARPKMPEGEWDALVVRAEKAGTEANLSDKDQKQLNILLSSFYSQFEKYLIEDVIMVREKATKNKQKSPVKNTKIAGVFAIENKEDVFDHIEFDNRVMLVREPDNNYDKNAIVVVNSEGNKLGYIPKSENAPFAKKMDSGEMGYIGQITDYDDSINEIYIDIFERPILPIDGMTSFECERICAVAWSRIKYSLDVKRHKFISEYNGIEGKQVIELVFNQNTWKKAWSSLIKCNFRAWDHCYDNSCTLDGEEWNLRVRFGKGKQLKSGGSNAYPTEWFYFQNLIDEWMSLEFPLKGNGKFYVIDS